MVGGATEVGVDEGVEVEGDQMSTSFDCEAVGGCGEETASRSVCTGVTCLTIEPVDALLDWIASASTGSAVSAPLLNSNPTPAPAPAPAPFSALPPTTPVSTAISLPLKSSIMFLNTCASYAGAGKIELCLRLTRFASDPGVATPLSDIELRDDSECAASCSSGVRSFCCEEV